MSERAAYARARELATYWAVGMLVVPLLAMIWIFEVGSTISDTTLASCVLGLSGPLIEAVARLVKRHRLVAVSTLTQRSFPVRTLCLVIAASLAVFSAIIVTGHPVGSKALPVLIVGLCLCFMFSAGVVQSWYADFATASDIDKVRTLVANVRVFSLTAGRFFTPRKITIEFETGGETVRLIHRISTALSLKFVQLKSDRLEATCSPFDERELLRRCAQLRVEGVRILGVHGDPSALFSEGAVLHATV